MSDLVLEARRQGYVALFLNEEGVDFYIELLHNYNAKRGKHDVAVFNDENYLRREREVVFGVEGDE